MIKKARKQTIEKVFYKLTQTNLGNFEISDQPPLVYHPEGISDARPMLEDAFNKYAKSLQADRRWLFAQYKLVDLALKVVGVGSVGTRCYVGLFMNKNNEPLFLQVKEARNSVLEPYTTKSAYKHHGQRVVEGQRLVQAASDVFLGWTSSSTGKQFYVRQLRDKKVGPDIENFDKTLLKGYGRLCGLLLARAHAKGGSAPLIAGYVGKSEALDEAIGKFAVAYANQTERDYEEFIKGIKAGKLEASNDVPELKGMKRSA